jgi:hypothetical protein
MLVTDCLIEDVGGIDECPNVALSNQSCRQPTHHDHRG